MRAALVPLAGIFPAYADVIVVKNTTYWGNIQNQGKDTIERNRTKKLESLDRQFGLPSTTTQITPQVSSAADNHLQDKQLQTNCARTPKLPLMTITCCRKGDAFGQLPQNNCCDPSCDDQEQW